MRATDFDGSNAREAERYKLFNDAKLRRVVFNRLRLQFAASGACSPNPEIHLCLACGNVYESGRVNLHAHFEAQGWELWDEPWLREKLKHMAKLGYENQVSAVVAKLLLRGKVE